MCQLIGHHKYHDHADIVQCCIVSTEIGAMYFVCFYASTFCSSDCMSALPAKSLNRKQFQMDELCRKALILHRRHRIQARDHRQSSRRNPNLTKSSAPDKKG